MANINADVLRVCNTEANLLTTLREKQFGLATDTGRGVFKAPGGAFWYYEAKGEDAAYADITSSTGVFKYDADNNIEITSTYIFVKANGSKIIDYLYANSTLALNADNDDIDIALWGVDANYPAIYVDASTNAVGINTDAPRRTLQITKAPGESGTNVQLGEMTNNTAKVTRIIATQYADTAEPEGFVVIRSNSPDANTNAVSVGGGSSSFNPSTQFDIFTAATPTTAGGGTSRLSVDKDGNIVINDSGAPIDVRIEGDTDANLFVTDGSADKVGIGTNAPSAKLHIANIASGTGLQLEGVVGGESNSILIKDTYDIRSNAEIGTLMFNGLRGGGGGQQDMGCIKLFVAANSGSSDVNTYMSFRVANTSGVLGSVFKMDYNKNTAYQDIYLDTGKTVRDASGNDILMHGYGEIYVDDGSTAQSIPTGTTYTKLTGFATNGEYDNSAITADAANDKIIIKKSGKYLVTGSTSFTSGTNSVVFKAAIFAGGTEKGNVHWARKVGTGADVGSASFTGIIDIDASGGNVDVDVRLRHDQAGSINFTPMYMNLTITEIR